MPIYKIKKQIMKNLSFTFPKHIFREHLYVTYHIYRYKQYITNIKIVRILITITATVIMLVINNNNDINNTIIITITMFSLCNVQCFLRRIWTTLTRQYSYAMFVQHGRHNIV